MLICLKRTLHCISKTPDHQLVRVKPLWCCRADRDWFVSTSQTHKQLCQVGNSKSIKWPITDSISPAMGSWEEFLLLLRHLIWMCSSVSCTSLPMSVGQVDCENLKCSKRHTVPHFPSLNTSALLSLRSPAAVISVKEIYFQFLFCRF